MIAHRSRFVALLMLVPFVASCVSATLRGVPQGLQEPEAKKILDAKTVQDSLDAANKLSFTYASARNECIDYRFWSSASYIPLAMIASWAIYAKASGDVLAGTGLVAGGVAGTTTLINPAGNAGVYQHGIDAIHCVQLALLPYADADAAASTIGSDRDALDDASRIASALADTIDAFPEANPTEIRSTKPDALAALLKARKKLGEAISAADAASAAADAEVVALHGAARFAGNLVFTLDGTVASKISQGSVDYAGQITAISGVMSSGKKKDEKKDSKGPMSEMFISQQSTNMGMEFAGLFDKPTKVSTAYLTNSADKVADELTKRAEALSTLVDQSAFPKVKTAAVQCLSKI